jgi:hypothetical protein
MLAYPGTEASLIYGFNYPYSAKTTLEPLLKEGDLSSSGNFGPPSATIKAYLEEFQAIYDLAHAQVQAANASYVYRFLPKETAEYDIGVAGEPNLNSPPDPPPPSPPHPHPDHPLTHP